MNDSLLDEESIKSCLANIHSTFDPGKKCLGKDWRINFNEQELGTFVSNLSKTKRKLLAKLIAFFYYHMKPLYKLSSKDETINDFLGSLAWSNFSLIVIMSILEKYTKGHYKRKDFLELLSENLPIISKDQLINLSEEQNKTNPPVSVMRFSKLFKNNLDLNEIEQIIKDYMAEKQSEGSIKVSSIEDVFKHLCQEVRSGFIHDIGIESIYNESTIFRESVKPNTIIVSSNLSMSNFLFLSWKAVFRDFGYKGELNSKFTKEEMKNKITVDGTKL